MGVVLVVNGQNACLACGGRGWKFLHLRRSIDIAGGASERALLLRPRVPCIFCHGTGERLTT